MPPEIPVLSALRTEFENLANDLGEELGGTLGPLDFLKDEVKPEELELRLGKASIVMRNAKEFLDNCDAFLQPLAGMNSTIAAPVYGAVKFIVTIAAAKSEVLEEVIAGLNEVFDGLPLITQSVKGSNGLLNPSDPQHRVILSALRAFVKFMEDVKGYVGGKHESLKEKVKRTLKSKTILGEVQVARKNMREALISAHYGSFITHVKDEHRRHTKTRLVKVVERLHCTNYDDHLTRYLVKSQSIKNPCAWSESQSDITCWLSHEPGTSQLLILGKPGTGKSVLAAHLIDRVAKMIQNDGSHRGVLLYYSVELIPQQIHTPIYDKKLHPKQSS
ncbi:hypothetical protein B0H10DRAFT_224637 [Mycena sp. CBHHK59/15]|nr:hypothetical protein B0H10DRAFT_224637 [Mycena sp. CBHHK59/15]